jgi:lipopolysaccharide biosynthesis glycosyltransferase
MSLTDIDKAFSGINKQQCAFIDKTIKEYNPENKVSLHDITDIFRAEMLNSPNIASFYTPYTLLRLFCDNLGLPGRIIYLDTDTAALSDIAPLYHYDLRGCELAGALDYLGKFFINPRYINAGVLLLDLEKIRQTGLFARARAFCATKKTAFPDQDAINRLVGKKRFIPRRYNEQRRVKSDTVIRHFSKTLRLFPYFHSLNIKPWEPDKLHKIYHCYEFDDILEEYAKKKSEWENESKGV